MENLTNDRNSPFADLSEGKPCAFLCGVCSSCVFAKSTPMSGDPLWTVGDSFQRRFLMDLLCRCRSPQVLEKMQRMLNLTSWSIFTYPGSPASSDPNTSPKPPEKPLGFNGHDIRAWFDSSPDLIKSHYLCRLLLRCDNDLLRALANLTNVLLIRLKRGLQTFEGCNINEDGELDEPAIMVVPGTSKSFSGISRYKDIISNLPVNLAKRILGFLDEPYLKMCFKVTQRWRLLAKETLSEIEFRKNIYKKLKEGMKSKDSNYVNPNYANVVKVQVPVSGNTSGGKEGHLEIDLVQMEERNVYCGGFFTTNVIEKHDSHRVIDYRGTNLMAAGSKNGSVHLHYVSVEAKVITVLKENVVQIHTLRICEDKNLVLSAGFDAIIRCWNLKTETCIMKLSGHTRTINCLDVCGDRLVSGSKDCTVKIWSLQQGKLCEEYVFKHFSSVRCVKIHQPRVYSGCDKGQVKIWDLEKAALLKVIDSHQSSVRCLFFNEWYLLTGDARGVVMVWSTHCVTKDCIKTFNHPKEVKSLTLTYLRVVTGCTDGKIRIFNFLTGDCLRVIATGPHAILSVHFYENCFVVNSTAHVKYFNFGEVFWDYANSTSKDKKHVRTEEGLISVKRKPPASAPVNKVSSPNGKTHNRRKSVPSLSAAATTQDNVRFEEQVKVALSEEAASARIKKRGPHHQLTREGLLLKLNARENNNCMDELRINMEHNASLRDDWSAPKPTNDLTNTSMSKTSTLSSKSAPQREVSTAPGRIPRPHPPLLEKTQSQSAKTQRLVNRSKTDNVSKEERPKNLFAKSAADVESFVKSTKNVKSVIAFNNQMEFKLLTTTQLEEQTKSQKDLKTKKDVIVKKKGQ